MVSPCDSSIWLPLMHVYEVVLHLLCREKCDVCDTKRLKNVFFEVFIKCEARDQFDEYTSPFNIDLEEYIH
jgi:hypothetical protein